MLKNELVQLSDNVNVDGVAWRRSRPIIWEETSKINFVQAMVDNFIDGEANNISYVDNLKNALRDAASIGSMSWLFQYDTPFLPSDKINEVKEMCLDEGISFEESRGCAILRWMYKHSE